MNTKTLLIVGCLVVFATFCVDKTLANEKIVPKLYEEIGCRENNASSPTSFDCPELTTFADNKCYLKGKTFNVGDEIEESVVPSCRAACQCIRRGNEKAHISCANVECPENFSRDRSCVSLYDNLKQCCQAGKICGKARRSQPIDTCEFEGKKYRYGERIYPNGGSCYNCLCGQGFDNKTTLAENPHCARIDCGIELNLNYLKDGCVPVYFESPTCCPIEYKCPTKDDAIDTAAGDNRLTCKFGDLTLGYGQKLKTTNKCVNCECSTPPYLTCVQMKNDDC